MTISPSPSPVLITAENLSVRFGDQRVIDDVNLTVAAGEIVTLIGPNGAGKSTILRALLGLVPASGGTVHKRAGLKVGYAPQKMAINQIMPMTAGRFVRAGLPGLLKGQRQVEEALDQTGAAHLIDKDLATLSGGEFQRVLIARAIVAKPDLLILDEPVQGVDVTGQLDLYELIADLGDRHGFGILIVSHDLHLVMARTTRVYCINGHVCCSGTPQSVAEDPAYIALFGKRGAGDLAVYAHDHDHSHDDHDHHHH